MRILIADDEISIAKALKVILEKNNFSADAVYNGADALHYLESAEYDAAVLDIMMPCMDGIDVLKRIREKGSSVPVMFLTAKGEINDKVAGLDAGADDYLPKPFNMNEFLARVRALTRRSGTYSGEIISFGNTKLDCGKYSVTANGSEKLCGKEYSIAELLFRNPKQVFSAERIMDSVWGYDSEAGTDSVWTYISMLRKKLKAIDSNAEIKTIRGAGYALEEIK